MKVAAPAVISATGIQVHQKCQCCCSEHHQRTEPVQYQYNTKGCLPVAQAVYLYLTLPCCLDQLQAHQQQTKAARQTQPALQAGLLVTLPGQYCTQQQRQDDGCDNPVVHAPSSLAFSLPSTWSLPSSTWARRASTSTKAVMAKPMTMAVNTRAWGTGSV